MDDKKLLKRYNQASEDAFREIYEMYFETLCRYAFIYVQTKEAAADIVQETFITLWKMCDKFSSLTALKSFLYVSVRNAALNHIKHRKVADTHRQAILVEMMSEQEILSVIDHEVGRILATSMSRLPDKCREVLVKSLEGKSYKQIGESMNITAHTVKNQRARALRLLREYCCDDLKVHKI